VGSGVGAAVGVGVAAAGGLAAAVGSSGARPRDGIRIRPRHTAAAAASRGSGLCLRGLFCARLG
ncbi:MAG: hypothetical protein ACLUKH_15010, partial [Flavonifractor plautii]